NVIKPGQVWDESSGKGHWKNRKANQPFFAVFNHTVSHESQLRKRPHQAVHDPAKAPVPAYHPDHPDVRQDWAQYYDKVTEMDAKAGANLAEIEAAGLAEDTIVFYYGDHGSGMPRSKRWPYNSGLHVPFIVYVPEKFRHLAPEGYEPGGTSDRLIGFIDLAPTVLSLVGIEPKPHMQGRAFMGPHRTDAPDFSYGFRGRMDERFDFVRSIRGKRFIYIRNYNPHKKYGQYIEYMFQTPTTRIWKKLYDEGKLTEAQKRFWEPKPAEEFFDLDNDPDEVNNLIGTGQHLDVLEKMRTAHERFVMDTGDLGFLPESEIDARSKGSTRFDLARDRNQYPIEKVVAAAKLATSRKPEDVAALLPLFHQADSAVRYWAATGLFIHGKEAVRRHLAPLRGALKDGSPAVRIAAARALAEFGDPEDLAPSLDALIAESNVEEKGVYLSMAALNAIDELDERARPLVERVKALPGPNKDVPGRMRPYVPSLFKRTLAPFDDTNPYVIEQALKRKQQRARRQEKNQ
ncbi:MAG: sulfatase-like hydrolase/transferase, partial [Verrucomicrobiota bacterium]